MLSAGHGSMLIYALLYLTGYEAMTIEEIKRFRQLGSITAGHPEFGHARRRDHHRPARAGARATRSAWRSPSSISPRCSATASSITSTYVLASDGDLMEGISQEAIALAGHLKLNKLIVLFDDNGISIDGALSLADSVDQVEALRGGRLDSQRGSTATIRQAIARGARKGADIRQADADRLQDHDRLRRADQGRHREELARLAARRG